MKKIVFIILLLNFTAHAQQWEWALQENVKKFAIDSAGNVFTFSDSTIKRFNSRGIFVWKKQFTGDLRISDMVADNSGNLYFAGNFTDFSMNANHFTSAGMNDVFFCKIDSLGTLMWSKMIGGPNNDYINDMHLTRKQQILICGNVGVGALIGNTLFSKAEFFIGRYDVNGNLELLFNHSGGDAWEVSADTTGNIYLLGGININDTLDFGNTVILYGDVPYGMGTHFMAKFNDTGNIVWANDMGSNYYQPCKHLGVANNGDFYLSKWQRYGGFDLYKFDGMGNYVWTGGEGGLYGDCNSLCVDNNDSLWVTGIDGNYPNYRGDPFIWEFDPTNNLIFTAPATVSSVGNNIANDYSNNVYVSGFFNDTATFGSTTLFVTAGNYFLAKINRNNGTTNLANNISENSDLLNVFPNPCSGIFTVGLKNKTVATKICVYNVMGNCVLDKVSGKKSNDKIDLSSQPAGIYFVQILSDGKRTTKKIILE